MQPSPALLRKGGTARLTAIGYDQYGDVILRLEFLLEADRLTINQMGNVSAKEQESIIPATGLASWWPGDGHANDTEGATMA